MLSARECEVIRWVAEGKTAWEVAGILGISKRTVEWHLKTVRTKANATNVVHAVARCVRMGLITIWGAGLAGVGINAAMAVGETQEIFNALVGPMIA